MNFGKEDENPQTQSIHQEFSSEWFDSFASDVNDLKSECLNNINLIDELINFIIDKSICSNRDAIIETMINLIYDINVYIDEIYSIIGSTAIEKTNDNFSTICKNMNNVIMFYLELHDREVPNALKDIINEQVINILRVKEINARNKDIILKSLLNQLKVFDDTSFKYLLLELIEMLVLSDIKFAIFNIALCDRFTLYNNEIDKLYPFNANINLISDKEVDFKKSDNNSISKSSDNFLNLSEMSIDSLEILDNLNDLTGRVMENVELLIHTESEHFSDSNSLFVNNSSENLVEETSKNSNELINNVQSDVELIIPKDTQKISECSGICANTLDELNKQTSDNYDSAANIVKHVDLQKQRTEISSFSGTDSEGKLDKEAGNNSNNLISNETENAPNSSISLESSDNSNNETSENIQILSENDKINSNSISYKIETSSCNTMSTDSLEKLIKTSDNSNHIPENLRNSTLINRETETFSCTTISIDSLEKLDKTTSDSSNNLSENTRNTDSISNKPETCCSTISADSLDKETYSSHSNNLINQVTETFSCTTISTDSLEKFDKTSDSSNNLSENRRNTNSISNKPETCCSTISADSLDKETCSFHSNKLINQETETSYCNSIFADSFDMVLDKALNNSSNSSISSKSSDSMYYKAATTCCNISSESLITEMDKETSYNFNNLPENILKNVINNKTKPTSDCSSTSRDSLSKTNNFNNLTENVENSNLISNEIETSHCRSISSDSLDKCFDKEANNNSNNLSEDIISHTSAISSNCSNNMPDLLHNNSNEKTYYDSDNLLKSKSTDSSSTLTDSSNEDSDKETCYSLYNLQENNVKICDLLSQETDKNSIYSNISPYSLDKDLGEEPCLNLPENISSSNKQNTDTSSSQNVLSSTSTCWYNQLGKGSNTSTPNITDDNKLLEYNTKFSSNYDSINTNVDEESRDNSSILTNYEIDISSNYNSISDISLDKCNNSNNLPKNFTRNVELISHCDNENEKSFDWVRVSINTLEKSDNSTSKRSRKLSENIEHNAELVKNNNTKSSSDRNNTLINHPLEKLDKGTSNNAVDLAYCTKRNNDSSNCNNISKEVFEKLDDVTSNNSNRTSIIANASEKLTNQNSSKLTENIMWDITVMDPIEAESSIDDNSIFTNISEQFKDHTSENVDNSTNETNNALEKIGASVNKEDYTQIGGFAPIEYSINIADKQINQVQNVDNLTNETNNALEKIEASVYKEDYTQIGGFAPIEYSINFADGQINQVQNIKINLGIDDKKQSTDKNITDYGNINKFRFLNSNSESNNAEKMKLLTGEESSIAEAQDAEINISSEQNKITNSEFNLVSSSNKSSANDKSQKILRKTNELPNKPKNINNATVKQFINSSKLKPVKPEHIPKNITVINNDNSNMIKDQIKLMMNEKLVNKEKLKNNMIKFEIKPGSKAHEYITQALSTKSVDTNIIGNLNKSPPCEKLKITSANSKTKQNKKCDDKTKELPKSNTCFKNALDNLNSSFKKKFIEKNQAKRHQSSKVYLSEEEKNKISKMLEKSKNVSSDKDCQNASPATTKAKAKTRRRVNMLVDLMSGECNDGNENNIQEISNQTQNRETKDNNTDKAKQSDLQDLLQDNQGTKSIDDSWLMSLIE